MVVNYLVIAKIEQFVLDSLAKIKANPKVIKEKSFCIF